MTHKYPWKWYLEDLQKVEKNGKTVFSCFACGGGSSMGYKLAGYDVIGNCEIDPKMAAVYERNNHPRFTYEMDIRDFNKLDDYPEELKNLDILDGSPPCSVFSMAGEREAGWNREKVFREGQKKQRLDDLFFAFIDTAEILKPKVIVAENVEGLVTGNAKGYVNEIVKAFNEAGYKVQLFLLDSRYMGVPQKRRRVFFIGHRKELAYKKLEIKVKENPILFGEVRSKEGVSVSGEKTVEMLARRRKGDRCMADIYKRESGRNTGFTIPINADDEVASTLTSGSKFLRFYDGKKFSKQDFVSIQTFPQDYDFLNQSPQYICGMSVPPVMMAHVAEQVYKQWLHRE